MNHYSLTWYQLGSSSSPPHLSSSSRHRHPWTASRRRRPSPPMPPTCAALPPLELVHAPAQSHARAPRPLHRPRLPLPRRPHAPRPPRQLRPSPPRGPREATLPRSPAPWGSPLLPCSALMYGPVAAASGCLEGPCFSAGVRALPPFAQAPPAPALLGTAAGAGAEATHAPLPSAQELPAPTLPGAVAGVCAGAAAEASSTPPALALLTPMPATPAPPPLASGAPPSPLPRRAHLPQLCMMTPCWCSTSSSNSSTSKAHHCFRPLSWLLQQPRRSSLWPPGPMTSRPLGTRGGRVPPGGSHHTARCRRRWARCGIESPLLSAHGSSCLASSVSGWHLLHCSYAWRCSPLMVFSCGRWRPCSLWDGYYRAAPSRR
jgi:hypothetical protein